MRKEMYFGLAIMGLLVGGVALFMPWGNLTNGHLGLLMLGLVVVAIMLGFPDRVHADGHGHDLRVPGLPQPEPGDRAEARRWT